MVITEQAKIECKAAQLAAMAHSGQSDKQGQPYIAHIARVVANCKGDSTARVVAWLHDVVEDTWVTVEDIRGAFGDEIANAVEAITHPDGEPQWDYIARVRANPIARLVKMADARDNSETWRRAGLDPETRARLDEKYTRFIVWLNMRDDEFAAMIELLRDTVAMMERRQFSR